MNRVKTLVLVALMLVSITSFAESYEKVVTSGSELKTALNALGEGVAGETYTIICDWDATTVETVSKIKLVLKTGTLHLKSNQTEFDKMPQVQLAFEWTVDAEGKKEAGQNLSVIIENLNIHGYGSYFIDHRRAMFADLIALRNCNVHGHARSILRLDGDKHTGPIDETTGEKITRSQMWIDKIEVKECRIHGTAQSSGDNWSVFRTFMPVGEFVIEDNMFYNMPYTKSLWETRDKNDNPTVLHFNNNLVLLGQNKTLAYTGFTMLNPAANIASGSIFFINNNIIAAPRKGMHILTNDTTTYTNDAKLVSVDGAVIMATGNVIDTTAYVALDKLAESMAAQVVPTMLIEAENKVFGDYNVSWNAGLTFQNAENDDYTMEKINPWYTVGVVNPEYGANNTYVGPSIAYVNRLVSSGNNSFSLSDISVFSGSSFSFPVSMANESGITAFQCDVYLPEGLMLNWNDEGEYDVVLNADRKATTHSMTASLQPDGAIRIVSYSSANKLFKGNEGELFTLNLTALDGCAENQKVEIRNIRLSTPDQQEYLLPNVSSTVSVKSYTPADANGDGEVTIVDVVAVVNALMGDFSGNFVFDAADMDQNGEITIVDVVAVVNTLMGGGEQEETPQEIMDIQLETKDGQVIKNGSKVSVNAEMVDMMIWGQVESNIYVRNLTGKSQGVYASVKTISGDAQICWGGSCVPLSEGASHTTGLGLVSANSSANLLIESLVMESNYMSVPVTRTVEVTVWTDSKPEEKYTAIVTYYYTPSYFDTNTRPVATRSNASILRSNLHVADAEVNAGESTVLYVKLDNAQAYTAMQMDMNLPEGLTIEGVEMVGDASHTVTYNEEGRIAAYSLANSRFHGGEALMAITVKADDSFTGAANVGFTNVRVVSTDVVETVLADALSTVIGGAKSIDGVEADENVQILYYSTTGAVSDAPHKGLNIIKRIWLDGRVEVSKEMKK